MDEMDEIDDDIDYLELARQASQRADVLFSEIYEIIGIIENKTSKANP